MAWYLRRFFRLRLLGTIRQSRGMDLFKSITQNVPNEACGMPQKVENRYRKRKRMDDVL
jgi:hypothetical protein